MARPDTCLACTISAIPTRTHPTPVLSVHIPRPAMPHTYLLCTQQFRRRTGAAGECRADVLGTGDGMRGSVCVRTVVAPGSML
ncbi:hypothetical protein OH77DRAFT_1126076 [Trametes cingulata]|nr:hypothetical protein OH77DRAFT_1126076 [Trametes cingulata]